MMSFQTVNTFSKRRRDDDSDSDDEPYMKKTRTWNSNPQQHHGPSRCQPPSSLPLRASPSPPRAVPGLEALTPAHSDGEGDSPASLRDEHLAFMSPRHDTDYAMQMDEDDFDVVGSQPPDSPFIATSFRPAKLNPDLFGRDAAMASSDRMPTPMYPTFHTGAMSGLGFPSSGMAGGMGMSMGMAGAFLKPAPHSTPRMMPPPRKHAASQDDDRSRRMPSPISEDEDIPDTPTALTQSQLERLSVTTHAGAVDAMDAEMDPPLVVPPTPRGRKRSGALTGMGRFSMGYRDDCEKCRLRVPGHYSHFLQQ